MVKKFLLWRYISCSLPIFILFDFTHYICAGFPMIPQQNPYYPQAPMPFYPGMIPPQMPYPPYFPQYPPSMMSSYAPPVVMNPSPMSFGPGAASLAAGLNLPLSDEANLTPHLGSHVQLPRLNESPNIPIGLLTAKTKFVSPQIGSAPFEPKLPNVPKKTATLPEIY